MRQKKIEQILKTIRTLENQLEALIEAETAEAEGYPCDDVLIDHLFEGAES